MILVTKTRKKIIGLEGFGLKIKNKKLLNEKSVNCKCKLLQKISSNCYLSAKKDLRKKKIKIK